MNDHEELIAELRNTAKVLMNENHPSCAKATLAAIKVIQTISANEPLTLYDFVRECNLVSEMGKERWLWLVCDGEEGWRTVSELSKTLPASGCGQTWFTYRRMRAGQEQWLESEETKC